MACMLHAHLLEITLETASLELSTGMERWESFWVSHRTRQERKWYTQAADKSKASKMPFDHRTLDLWDTSISWITRVLNLQALQVRVLPQSHRFGRLTASNETSHPLHERGTSHYDLSQSDRLKDCFLRPRPKVFRYLPSRKSSLAHFRAISHIHVH